MIDMKRLIISILLVVPMLSNATILNMIAIEEFPELNKVKIKEQLFTDWKIEIDTSDISMSETAIAFEVEGEMIGIMNMDVAIPWKEIEGPCRYSPTWEEAGSEMQKHKAHQIITIMTKNSTLIEREILMNKVVFSFLNLTKSIGVYIGRSQLIRSKNEFIEEAKKINENNYPIANWVFFGLAETKNGNAGFTIGLKHFGYKEFEVLKSEKKLDEIYSLFYNTTSYVVKNSVKLKKKETIGYTEEMKLTIKITKSSITEDKKVILINF